MFELTGFQRDVLTVIAGLEKPSGQTVKEEIEKEIDEVNHGRLYPNLDALVENGLVEKGQLDRRTNYYALSESGREALKNRRRWENDTVPNLTDD
ncbi:transcriptional regulator, PadR family protein [Halogeometricum pallidum JCM 14848]|uniref:Transcriptional regulator, PadR family protein n=1 Tax=Halogeometricum pallidum JCM 14848 TaxID=1227487 RepID=M0DF17_HALPD|nr:PadR family transcriptional regulator [Halogeometricum pallidum]ELZ33403.1 transcriptional regulator, PadR family protein [Halogeometricum pallidum JCM 14848]